MSELSIEEARQELLEHAGVVCYDEYGVAAVLELADAYALAVLAEAKALILPRSWTFDSEGLAVLRTGLLTSDWNDLHRRISRIAERP